MHTSKLILALGAVLAAFAQSPAHASSTSHLVISGTAAEIHLGAWQPPTPDGCVADLQVSLTAATSIGHSDGGGFNGAGANGFITNYLCDGTVEYGYIDIPLSSGLTTGPHSVTLDATIVVTMIVFDQYFNFIGTVDRTLVASSLVFDTQSNNTVSSKYHHHSRFPTFKSVSDGHSVEKAATVSGTLTFDGRSLLADPSSSAYDASIGTSHQVYVTIYKS
jgi:hypothetical protein